MLDVVSKAPKDEGTDVAQRPGERCASSAYDAVVYFPPSLPTGCRPIRPTALRRQIEPPRPEVFFSSAKDRSRVAYERVATMLDRWRAAIVEQTLVQRDIPVAAATPFQLVNQDVAEISGRRAAMWSKILPFVLIVWALTGAFYPAIDLCAGEKERGTLETLLCSPAERREIVWGKLLTVTLFSVVTSLLNLLSMTGTGAMIMGRLQAPEGVLGGAGDGRPATEHSVVAAGRLDSLVRAVQRFVLALATMARSSKEGQYYLMPLLLVTMPLAMIPIMPTSEISLGNSLVPVTGVMLLLRCLMEGDYLLALKYAGSGRRRDWRLLLAGDSLGGGSVQRRIGSVSRG